MAAGALLLDPDADPALHPAQAGHAEYRRFVDSMPQLWDWKYSDVRGLRAIVGDQSGKRPSPELANIPVEVLARAKALRPTSAPEIRKLVKQHFLDRYGARPENLGGGDWRYSGSYRGRSFAVRIGYDGRDQLRYEVEYDDPPRAFVRGDSATNAWLGPASGTGTLSRPTVSKSTSNSSVNWSRLLLSYPMLRSPKVPPLHRVKTDRIAPGRLRHAGSRSWRLNERRSPCA